MHPIKKSIGIDIGGTKVLGGVVDESGNILATHLLDTPSEGGRALTETIAHVARVLRQEHEVTSVGVSAAGFISLNRKMILASPNIKNWNQLNLYEELSPLIDCDIVIENDANAAAWGESRFGAGRGHKNMLMLTLGTGVGGGLIIEDSLFRGSFGIGAELGHIRLIPDGFLCGCGIRGCLEQYASGTALLRFVRDAILLEPDEGKKFLKATNSTMETVTGAMVTEAARAGNSIALRAFNILSQYLGEGIASLCAVIDPKVIVIGGGVIEAGDIVLDQTRKIMKESLPFSGMHPLPEIVPAELGNNAGLVGVADLARNKRRD